MRAKTVVYAGLSLLLHEVDLTFADISTCYIAGGFGKHLDIQKAIIIGMLPDQRKEKNTAEPTFIRTCCPFGHLIYNKAPLPDILSTKAS